MAFENILNAYKQAGRNLLPVVGGDVASDLIKKGLEFIPNSPIKGAYAKIAGSLLLIGASAFVKDPTAKAVLNLGGTVGLWNGIKELVKEKGIYPLGGENNEISLEVSPEVVFVPSKEEEKKYEEKIEVYESPAEIEVA